jgi:hypothetical protein
MSYPFHPWFYYPDNIWWRVQITKLFVTYAVYSCHFLLAPKVLSVLSSARVCVLVFEVLRAVLTKTYVFWDITPCSPLKINRRFGVTCRLLQCESRLQAELLCCTHLLSRWFLVWLIFRTWRRRRLVPAERPLTFSGPHGVLSYGTELLSFCPSAWERVSHPRRPTREAYARINFLFSGLSSKLIYTRVWKHPINWQDLCKNEFLVFWLVFKINLYTCLKGPH